MDERIKYKSRKHGAIDQGRKSLESAIQLSDNEDVPGPQVNQFYPNTYNIILNT